MTGIDAEEMRERSKAGQRAQDLQELIDGVMLECNDAARFGNTSTVVKLSDSDAEFREDLIEFLKERDYVVTEGSKSNFLHLSWTLPSE